MAVERLEPGCTERQIEYLRSIAISLKRIADQIEQWNYRGAVLTQPRRL